MFHNDLVSPGLPVGPSTPPSSPDPSPCEPEQEETPEFFFRLNHPSVAEVVNHAEQDLADRKAAAEAARREAQRREAMRGRTTPYGLD